MKKKDDGFIKYQVLKKKLMRLFKKHFYKVLGSCHRFLCGGETNIILDDTSLWLLVIIRMFQEHL